jgi:hypothetical protein
VHVPHYCHMFEGIMAGPRPWRFGHVYLPGGSEALGTPAAAIQPLQSASRWSTAQAPCRIVTCSRSNMSSTIRMSGQASSATISPDAWHVQHRRSHWRSQSQ